MENSRIHGEHFFTSSDNTALFYRHWPALQPGAKKVIVLFHRGHEHSGRLQHLVDELAMPDTVFYAWDARGHGQTSGPRGYSPSLARSVQDVDEFVRFAASDSQVGLDEVVVIAQSVGAVLVATWVHNYAPAIRGLVLASPAFKVKLYVPLARPALALWHRLRGLFFINSYVKGRYLTHDRQRVASFNNDPLITRAIAVNILLDLYKTSERIIRDAAVITPPTRPSSVFPGLTLGTTFLLPQDFPHKYCAISFDSVNAKRNNTSNAPPWIFVVGNINNQAA